MLPQNVARERWRYGQEFLFAQLDHLTAGHFAERAEVHGEQGELILSPVEPIDDMLLRPFAGI